MMWEQRQPGGNERTADLPGGLILDDVGTEADVRPLRVVSLVPLCGYEEEWLAQHPGMPSALVVGHLLHACLRLNGEPVSRDLVGQLLVGDRDYLMLHLRRITLGDAISAIMVCPSCAAKMDVDFTCADVPVERRPQTASTYMVDLTSPDGLSRTVRVRLPTGADQEAVVALDSESAVSTLLRRCLVDDDGTPPSPAEQTVLIEAMERLAPLVEPELDLTCPECAHTFVVPFDFTAFFLDEMYARANQLLHEIHHLALHYHWSEAAILRMTRVRRWAYLSFLGDELHHN